MFLNSIVLSLGDNNFSGYYLNILHTMTYVCTEVEIV